MDTHETEERTACSEDTQEGSERHLLAMPTVALSQPKKILAAARTRVTPTNHWNECERTQMTAEIR